MLKSDVYVEMDSFWTRPSVGVAVSRAVCRRSAFGARIVCLKAKLMCVIVSSHAATGDVLVVSDKFSHGKSCYV